MGEFGRLDILVNNAGVMLLGPIVDAPVEEWRRMIELNLLGLQYCTHAALPHLLRAAESEPRRVADLVNVSSVAGRLRAHRQRGLQRDQVRGHGVLRVAPPGGHPSARAGHPGRAGRGDDRARRPQPPEIIEGMRANFGDTEMMQASDIAETILFALTRPRRVVLNEILIRPTEQER